MQNKFNSLTDCFTLHNGVKMPCMGFGTWRLPLDGGVCEESVKYALKVGFRHIDTAQGYRNEAGVGKAVAESGLKREDVFITSKVLNCSRGYENTLAAFDISMKKLAIEVMDCYLIHWPANSKELPYTWERVNKDTWRAMEELYKEGRIRAIGVSNFLPHHLKPLMETAEIMPMVNQLEIHPGFGQFETVKFSQENGIIVTAYSPLGNGEILNNEVLIKMAEKYGKSVPHICYRWVLQHDIMPLTRSHDPERIATNGNIFDFELSDEGMAEIDALPFIGGAANDPDTVII